MADLPDAVKQSTRGQNGHIGAAEFCRMAALNRPAELHGGGLLSVTDREDRHTGIEDNLRRARRALIGDRSRTTRQDDRTRLHLLEGLLGGLERHDFGIDAQFAHTPGNQLCDLGTEIDDENLVVAMICHTSTVKLSLLASQDRCCKIAIKNPSVSQRFGLNSNPVPRAERNRARSGRPACSATCSAGTT